MCAWSFNHFQVTRIRDLFFRSSCRCSVSDDKILTSILTNLLQSQVDICSGVNTIMRTLRQAMCMRSTIQNWCLILRSHTVLQSKCGNLCTKSLNGHSTILPSLTSITRKLGLSRSWEIFQSEPSVVINPIPQNGLILCSRRGWTPQSAVCLEKTARRFSG